MLCWGSWANTFKMAGNWRFELFYFDYSIGVLLTAAIAAFTLGTMGSDGFQFLDDLMQTGRRNIFYGFMGGAIFNLANMLLLGAISVAGMAVSFPLGFGTALVIGVVWNFFLKPQGNAVLQFGGAAIVLAAVVVTAFAHKAYGAVQLETMAKAGMLKTSAPKVSPKGIVLGLASGLFMGSFLPLVDLSRTQGAGLGPYGIGAVFAAGVFCSTLVFNLFFMNLPVQGQPVEILDYIRRGNWKRHMLGLAGGVIWSAGAILTFVAAGADPGFQVSAGTSYAIGQGAGVLGALCGVFLWKEFAGADFRVKNLLYVMVALFICGLTMVSLASP
jgi:glucose uptake protein